MYVVKRDGRQETVHFDKITARLKKLSYGLSVEHCDPVLVAQKLDELAAETAAATTANHPDYSSDQNHGQPCIKIIDNHVNKESGLKAPLVADDVYEMIIKKQREPKETSIDLERLVSARKRLHENYQEATNAKKQRKIQVVDLHDIPNPKIRFFGNKGGYQVKHW
ncbi:hypothetical protein NE237_002642 [Protea cynaroides]|uniref:ATP-cone domain-containing protein n=1 Tax=Protea cynaroides TaxID=273540 RepID=A0A9Q0GMV8_9MAGN|nr:hypothetical protein NE237_002642 [Protea cynaroides]